MAEKDEDSSQHVETTRTQAFSDAVFAIAITLLVLDLKPPHLAPGQSLGRALLAMWPYYVALLTSFGVIGLMWIHHHRVFRYLDHANHILLKINLLLMLGVSIVPFPTALLAE
ncbi:MAG TPA: TMEM175 family protein, partial [Kofleriaceae bacterium]